RLFDLLRSRAEAAPPRRAEDLSPLMSAVAHGCQAGRNREAWHAVYLRQIMRHDEFYAVHRLGEGASWVSPLAHCSEPGRWDRIADGGAGRLTRGDQFLVLVHAGSFLTACQGYSTDDVSASWRAAHGLVGSVKDPLHRFALAMADWRR